VHACVSKCVCVLCVHVYVHVCVFVCACVYALEQCNLDQATSVTKKSLD